MMTLTSTAIILAAGFSTRMGQCKASLPWHEGQTLLSYQVNQFCQVGVQPIVVLGGHNAYAQGTRLSSCAVAINPDPSQGKVSSILTGLSQLPEQWDALFIASVDQPRPASVYQHLLDAFEHSRAPITLPTYGQRTGHPALFARDLLPQLKAIREETCGLRQVVQDHRNAVDYVSMNAPIVLTDLNTPTLYRDALVAHR